MNNIEELRFGYLLKLKDATDITLNSAISEFIDNSISSFYSDKNSYKPKLNIQICFFQEDKKYWIIDNAYGIEDIDAAMTSFYGLKNNASMNQYGYGMKAGIFYLGKFGKIYTKNLNESKITVAEWVPKDFNDDNYKKLPDDEYIGKPVTHKKVDNNCVIPEFINDCIYKGGTCIEIENVYRKRGLTHTESIPELQAFLGYKYYNYLKENVNIEIKSFHNINEFKTYNVKPKIILDDACKLSELIKNESTINENDIKNIKSKLQNYLSSLETYYDKLLKNEKLIFDDEIIISENIKLPIKVCFLDTKDKKNKDGRGLAIIHNKRYILQPGINKNLFNFYKDSDKEFEGHWKWVYGEINLEDIPGNQGCKYIYPDKNKRNIVFSDSFNISEENFRTSINEYFKKIHPFIKDLISINNNSTSNKSIKKEVDESIKNNFISKNCVSSDNGTINYESKSNENTDCKISINEINDSNKPLINLISHSENEYIYEYNLHFEWTNDTTYKTNIKYLLTKMDFEFRNNRNKFKDIIDLLDYVVKDWNNN